MNSVIWTRTEVGNTKYERLLEGVPLLMPTALRGKKSFTESFPFRESFFPPLL